MCGRCWKFITVAVKVLDDILRSESVPGSTHCAHQRDLTDTTRPRRRFRLQAHPLGLFRSAWYPRVDLGPRRTANDRRTAFGDRAVHRHRQGLHKHGQAHGTAPASAPDNRVSRIARALPFLERHRARTQQSSDSRRSSAPQTGGLGTAAVGVRAG